MTFEKIDLKHRKIFEEIIDKSDLYQDQFHSEISFVNLYVWRRDDAIEVNLSENGIIIKSTIKENTFFLPPISKTKIQFKALIKQMEAYASEKQIPFIIHSVTDSLLPLFSEEYLSFHNRHLDEYIYSRNDLFELSGKKFKDKRNHVNQFIKSYTNYYFLEYTPDYFDLFIDFLDRTMMSEEEKIAILDTTKLEGIKFGILLIDYVVQGFSIGLLNNGQGLVLFEKADTNFSGIYAFLNQSFNTLFFPDAQYINRQEDMGIANLRKAKLSYNPVFLCQKHTVILKSFYDEFIELYKTAFQDSNEFTEMFFKEMTNFNNFVYTLHKNEVVSYLNLMDRTIAFNGGIIACPFIVGAVTKENFRNKGYFRKTILATFKKLYGEFIDVVMLNPFDTEYYKQFGFITYNFVDEKSDQFSFSEEIDLSFTKDIYQNAMSSYDGYSIRSDESFEVFWNSHKHSHKYKIQNQKYLGYAIIDLEVEEVILNEVESTITGSQNLNYFVEGTSLPYNMIRIVNIKNLLAKYDFNSEVDFKLKVTDQSFELNNITLHIKNSGGKNYLSECSEFDYQYSIEELSELLFLGTEHPKNTFESYFPKKRNFIYEKI